MNWVSPGQKAPSAIRCIKTSGERDCLDACLLGQKAPSAIRCIKTVLPDPGGRRQVGAGQKAPSAIRCIKTGLLPRSRDTRTERQKAPSAIRCIKTLPDEQADSRARRLSESTERQKVH